jgi:hypothetical protein
VPFFYVLENQVGIKRKAKRRAEERQGHPPCLALALQPVDILCMTSASQWVRVLHRFQANLAIMNPNKVDRQRIRRFTDLPNIGPASARDFELLGFKEPAQLVGADPYELYLALCAATGSRQDPCVLDVFMSVTHFMAGGPPEPWWHFTEQRKRQYGQVLEAASR